MSTRPAHVCATPNCSELVRGAAKCPSCTKAQSSARTHTPEHRKFYGSSDWQKIRAIVKARDPICKICNRRPTESADHIDPEGPKRDLTNLQGACWPCHRSKSGKEHAAKNRTR